MGMVVRTNTMALNAYRQLGMNNSAVSKSLEKLSSGFRINRAGDDAAGLAISEKMKAQITGLETASANAQDGISLIQTAEGNLNEVHSMLNRMVELATKSANGTYTDIERNALQDEVNSLLEEIDRIAKSANFNGTKLLDGSLDQGGKAVSGGFTLPPVEKPALGDKTYLHGDSTKAAKTEFTVSFDTMKANLADGDKLELAIGEDGETVTLTLDIDAATAKEYTAGDLATAFKAEFDKLTGANAGTGKINADTFDAKIVNGNQLQFVQKADPTSEDEVVDANLDVKMTYTAKDQAPVVLNGDIAVQAAGTLTGTANNAIDLDPSSGTAATAAVFKTAVTAGGTALAENNVIKIGNDEYTVVADSETINDGEKKVKVGDVSDATKIATFIASKATESGDYNVTADSGSLVYTAKTAGAIGTSGPSAVPTALEVKFLGTTGGSDISGFSIAAVGNAESGTGTEAAPSGKTVDASGLNKDAIQTAISAADANGDLNGAVTISKNDTGKLELKIGEKVIGTSTEAAPTAAGSAAVTVTFTSDGTAGGTALGTIELSKDVTASDLGTAIETGLTYGAGDPVGPDKPAEKETVASTAIDMTGVTADTANKDATLSNADVTQLKTLFAAGTKTSINSEIEVDLGGIADGLATDGSAKVSDLATAILNKAKEAVTAWNTANGETKGYTYENVRISSTNDENGVMTLAAAGNLYILADKTPKVAPPAGGGTTGVTGNYNAATINNTQGAVEGGGKFASTQFNLSVITDKGSLDGATLKIGDDEYTFQLGDENKVDGKTIIIDKNTAEDDLLHQAGELLSRVTDNKAFTIGHEGDGKIVLDEKKGNTSYLKELTSKPGFESLLSFKTTTAKDSTKGLTLQIGDTAEDFNKMTVSIANMSTEGLDIKDLKITTEDLASKAMDKIKTAINTVSTARAGMGALQNRLEHTINNLDVAVENLSAANSRIRDTDMAKEMMNYTKMNVLVQSAQAMLAQANQQPQSVLQLLQ